MEILNRQIDKYMLDNLAPRDEILAEMEYFAAQHQFPIIGPQAGIFLHQLVRLSRAKNIFEMGSGFGYSALWMAKGLRKGSKIICTDGAPHNKKRALKYFKRAGLERLMEFHVGDACKILGKYPGPFDIILNDIDKEDYPEAYNLALPRLKKGGIFLSDNVLWHGRILANKPDKATGGILKFNNMLLGAPELISNIIPIRDGLGLAIKR